MNFKACGCWFASSQATLFLNDNKWLSPFSGSEIYNHCFADWLLSLLVRYVPIRTFCTQYQANSFRNRWCQVPPLYFSPVNTVYLLCSNTTFQQYSVEHFMTAVLKFLVACRLSNFFFSRLQVFCPNQSFIHGVLTSDSLVNSVWLVTNWFNTALFQTTWSTWRNPSALRCRTLNGSAPRTTEENDVKKSPNCVLAKLREKIFLLYKYIGLNVIIF